MASTQLADVYVPAVFNALTSVNDPELSALVTSGIMERNPAIDGSFSAGGITATIPYYKDLTANVEANYSTDSPTDVAVPQKVTTGLMNARIANINQGWSSADLTAELSGSNPLTHVRNRVDVWFMRQMQRRLIAMVKGVYNANFAGNKDMIVDIGLQTTAGIADANRFSASAVIDAAFTMGDAVGSLAGMLVHSKIAAVMAKENNIAFVRPSEGSLLVGNYMGLTVVVDDSNFTVAGTDGTTPSTKYVTTLFGPGAFGFGQGTPTTPSAIQRFENQGNGGGLEQLWVRKSWVIHPYGWKWNEATVSAQSPTFSDLALAGNWTRQLSRKQVPMSFLLTNL